MKAIGPGRCCFRGNKQLSSRPIHGLLIEKSGRELAYRESGCSLFAAVSGVSPSFNCTATSGSHRSILLIMRQSVSDLLRQTAHRNWPIPAGRPWQFYQEWNQTLFLHWAVEPEVLRPFVPAPLELDLFDGKAWVSLVAFYMDRVHPRGLPVFPPLSNFLELNVRTYTRGQELGGVYFLSLEASKRVPAWLARRLSGLPYRYSILGHLPGHYYSRNIPAGDLFSARYQYADSPHEKSDLEIFLTERYGLFHASGTGFKRFAVHHIPWELRAVELEQLEVAYPLYADLLQGPPQSMQYAPGVQVLTWRGDAVSADELTHPIG